MAKNNKNMSQENEQVKEEAVKEEVVKEEDPKQEKKPSRSEAKAEAKAEKKAAELEAKVAELEKEIEKQKAQVKAEKDDYVRLMAEFETFRRRNAEERLKLVTNASKDTIKGLLPVLDDCEAAMKILSTSSDEAAKEGTTLIYNKLLAYLKTKGLSIIEAKGQKFDTDFHEAVAQFPAAEESQKNIIIDVVKTGYKLGDEILRYAQVVVGV
jgi:molecular chaperone GrpE